MGHKKSQKKVYKQAGFGRWLKSAALITLVAFTVNTVCQDFAYAARSTINTAKFREMPDTANTVRSVFSIADFHVPEYLGEVKDRFNLSSEQKHAFNPNNSDQQSTIIHIQDAHCNYDAQHKIAEIIGYLSRTYDVTEINLEGGEGEYDLSIFTDVKDGDIREQVADSFVKDGELNGAEFYAIQNPGKVNLWGVEDPQLYVKNLNVYRDIAEEKDNIDRLLKNFNNLLNNFKIHIFNKELIEFDTQQVAFKNNNLNLKEYIDILEKLAQRQNIELIKYPNIGLLLQTIDIEKKIDFKEANRDREKIIDTLKRDLSKTELEELFRKVFQFKCEKLSREDFYNYLAHKARCIGIDVEKFSNLLGYRFYTATYDNIDKAKLFEEMESLEEKLKDRFAVNPEQKQLFHLSKNFAIIKAMLNVQLTKRDYEYYSSHKTDFDIQNFTSFIAQNSFRYKLSAKADENVVLLNDYIRKADKFYEYSFKRDSAFLKNIRSNTKNKVAVLITGGFHTDNLCALMKEQNISYVSIMPKFKNPPQYKSPYFRILEGGLPKEDKNIAQKLGISMIAIVSSNSILGDKVRAKKKDVIRIIATMRIADKEGKKGIVVDGEYFDLNWNIINSSTVESHGEFKTVSFMESTWKETRKSILEERVQPVAAKKDTTVKPSSGVKVRQTHITATVMRIIRKVCDKGKVLWNRLKEVKWSKKDFLLIFIAFRLLLILAFPANSPAVSTDFDNITDTQELALKIPFDPHSIKPHLELNFDNTTDTDRLTLRFPLDFNIIQPYCDFGYIKGGRKTAIDNVPYLSFGLKGVYDKDAVIIGGELKGSWLDLGTKTYQGDEYSNDTRAGSSSLYGAQRFQSPIDNLYLSFSGAVECGGAVERRYKSWWGQVATGTRLDYQNDDLPINIGVYAIKEWDVKRKSVNSAGRFFNSAYFYDSENIIGLTFTYYFAKERQLNLGLERSILPTVEKMSVSGRVDDLIYGDVELELSRQDSNHILWPKMKEVKLGYTGPSVWISPNIEARLSGGIGFAKKKWGAYSEDELFGRINLELLFDFYQQKKKGTVKTVVVGGMLPKVTSPQDKAFPSDSVYATYSELLLNGGRGSYDDFVRFLKELKEHDWVDDILEQVAIYGGLLGEKYEEGSHGFSPEEVYNNLINGEPVGNCADIHSALAKTLNGAGIEAGSLEVLAPDPDGGSHILTWASLKKNNSIIGYELITPVGTKNPEDLVNSFSLRNGTVGWSNSVFDHNGFWVGDITEGTSSQILHETFEAGNGKSAADMADEALKRVQSHKKNAFRIDKGKKGNFIGKLFKDREAIDQRKEGVVAKEEAGWLVFYDCNDNILYTKDGKEARVKLTSRVKEIDGQTIRIIGDNENIRGFGSVEGIQYLTEFLLNEKIARYHEKMESLYAETPQKLPTVEIDNELIRLNAHTYLRGCGKEIRKAYRELITEGRNPDNKPLQDLMLALDQKMTKRKVTKEEIVLIRYNIEQGEKGKARLYGRQDKEFEEEANERLTAKIRYERLTQEERVKEISKTLTSVFGRVRFPKKKTIILMPRPEDEVLFGEVMKAWKWARTRIKNEYNMGNILVRFYDKTNRMDVLQKTQSDLEKNSDAYAMVYAKEEMYDQIDKGIKAFSLEAEKRIGCVKERIDDGELELIMVGTHVVLAQGLIDLLRNDYEHDENRHTLIDNIANLLFFLTGGDENVYRMFKKNPKSIFKKDFLLRIKPFSEELEQHLLAVEEVSISL